ncbi:MAG: VWA domain-containing protein [Gammaproteobacteria bacterium]
MFRSVLYCCIGLSLLTCPAVTAASDEIQVLIDVSGSMKQNDPGNLRSDATQLLIKLLPDGTKVALWLFAEETAPLSQSDTVDDQWREQALSATKSIHSRGLYTNIENAIDIVLKNGFAGVSSRNLILLTDGMVDISKDIMVSAESRERILAEWIPRLRQGKIKVYTIALSNQADKELLEKLALDTDGWSETAKSAEHLQRLFVKMALKAAPKDTVPIENNRFNIDSSIREFSVLLFKKAGAVPTQLLTPNRETIDKQNAPPNVSWLDTPGYDLITVKQPMSGDWQIVAEIDPDSQVMILTDLQLHLEELGSYFGEKDELPLKLYFTEQDKLITRKDFLELVRLSISVDGEAPTALATLNGQAGFFGKTLLGLPLGKHQLKFGADGKTFQREISREIEIVPSPILLEKEIDAENRQITLNFIPDEHIINVDTLSLMAHVVRSGHEAETYPVKVEAGKWQLRLDSLAPNASVSVHFNVMAQTPAGKTIEPAIAPITIDDGWFSDLNAPTAPEQTVVNSDATESGDANLPNELAVEQLQTIERNTESESADKPNWWLTGGLVVLANIILAGIIFFVYRTFIRNATKQQQQILERLS